MQSGSGWLNFGIVWSIAIFGAVLKLFFTGRYKAISLALYLIMGWIIVFVLKSLESYLETGYVFNFFRRSFLYVGNPILLHKKNAISTCDLACICLIGVCFSLRFYVCRIDYPLIKSSYSYQNVSN